MFHRRLALLWGLAAVVTSGLAAQVTRLAVGQGAERLAAAERRLNLVTFLPTYRGRILDRHGRVLAVDRPAYDVAVDYEVITGAWAVQGAARRARSAHRAEWASMSPREREAAVAQFLPEYQQRVEELWAAVMDLGGLDRAELDLRLDAIKHEVQSTAAVVWDRQLREALEFGRGAGEGTDFRPRPIREQRQPHVVLPRVTDQVAFAFRRLAERSCVPGLSKVIAVQDSHRRAYPWNTAEITLDRSTLPQPVRLDEPIRIRIEGVADHLLGSMRDDTWEGDLKRRPFKDRKTGQIDLGGYRIGDSVGARGLERAFEDHLRGRRGVFRKRLDTGREEREPRVPGEDLHLTLDIALQARIQAILSPELGLARVHQWQSGWAADGSPHNTGLPPGTPLNSAAVVLEVATGDILAMVSIPTVAMGLQIPPECREAHEPWVNRPVEAIYPPGSTIKPLVLAAAVSEGVLRPDEPIECTGHFFPDRADRVRCWVYRPPTFATHGPLVVEPAIARSCNIYFYSLGDRLGMARLAAWYRRFGLGRPLEVGLLYRAQGTDGQTRWFGESAGTVPDEQEVARLRATGELRFTSVILGIGQGPVTLTPIQAAHAYATLARGGAPRQVSIVKEARREEARQSTPALPEPYLDGQLVERVLEGLRESVEESHGTGHHIRYSDGTLEPIMNIRGVTVWAKTGTAQAPPARIDLDCDGEPDVQLDDPSHAWFVGLIGPTTTGPPRPLYALALVIEYGGSGGRTAGPIANQIIRSLQAEGYLTDGEL
jgi:penicillin-binding protein 2